LPDLWRTLGYDEIAVGVARGFRDSDRIAVLEGPPGVGKSWLARGIGALWQAGGGSAIVAEGDSSRSDFAYYPLGFAMGGLASGWKSVAPGVATVAKAAETLVGTAGIITSAVQGLAAMRRVRRHGRRLLLDDVELDVLHELERLAGKKPFVIIADNLHWWDRQSLSLLRRLHEPRMQAAFPFLAQARVLAVQTTEPYQSVAHPEARDALLSPNRTTRRVLSRIPRAGFENVLEALGTGGRVAPDVADVVYAFSGGHLALAARAASRIADGSADTFLAVAHSDDFLRLLLVERIHLLGALGAQVAYLLQVAAILGLTFRRDEVTCASDVGDAEGARLLRYCRDEQILELADGTGRFVHDLYRQFFLSAAARDRVAIHERLAECLRILRPSDYDLRSVNSLRAERPAEAASFGVQAALQRQREGRSLEDLPAEVVEATRARDLERVIERFASARDDLNRYRFTECLASLDRLPRTLAKPLLAEADYLRAMCLMSTRCESDRAEGCSLLAAWSGYEEEEPEVGIRLARLLLYGLSHLLDKTPARELEGRIRQTLVDRVSFDASAKDELYTMDRCSGSLYQPEVEVVRTREAATHFGPAPGQTVIRRPVEYYRCIVNLGASLISNALYNEARSVYDDVESLISDYPTDAFPRTDYPRMNHLLADYRVGFVDAGVAVDRQRAIAASLMVENDPFYVQNALAVYLTLIGSDTEANEIFDSLNTELHARLREPEPSMVYLIGANRCAARFVSGDRAVLAEWDRLGEVAQRIAYTFRPILIRRHHILRDLIADSPTISAREFDDYPLASHPNEFGPLWNNFGHGFRMPEVEFWREN
jgi:hypothetical protein